MAFPRNKKISEEDLKLSTATIRNIRKAKEELCQEKCFTLDEVKKKLNLP